MPVTMESHPVACTIQDQIGRRAFFMMGAKDLIASQDALGWRVGRNAKGVTHVTVTLDPTDTYTVTFRRVTRRGLSVKTIDEVSMVYADNLHEVIESGTGLYLSL